MKAFSDLTVTSLPVEEFRRSIANYLKLDTKQSIVTVANISRWSTKDGRSGFSLELYFDAQSCRQINLTSVAALIQTVMSAMPAIVRNLSPETIQSFGYANAADALASVSILGAPPQPASGNSKPTSVDHIGAAAGSSSAVLLIIIFAVSLHFYQRRNKKIVVAESSSEHNDKKDQFQSINPMLQFDGRDVDVVIAPPSLSPFSQGRGRAQSIEREGFGANPNNRFLSAMGLRPRVSSQSMRLSQPSPDPQGQQLPPLSAEDDNSPASAIGRKRADSWSVIMQYSTARLFSQSK